MGTIYIPGVGLVTEGESSALQWDDKPDEKEPMKEDPKLQRARVEIKYSSDDGFRCEWNTISGKQPKAALIDGIYELARLLELFGFGEEAQNAVNEARGAVQDWRAKREPRP